MSTGGRLWAVAAQGCSSPEYGRGIAENHQDYDSICERRQLPQHSLSQQLRIAILCRTMQGQQPISARRAL